MVAHQLYPNMHVHVCATTQAILFLVSPALGMCNSSGRATAPLEGDSIDDHSVGVSPALNQTHSKQQQAVVVADGSVRMLPLASNHEAARVSYSPVDSFPHMRSEVSDPPFDGRASKKISSFGSNVLAAREKAFSPAREPDDSWNLTALLLPDNKQNIPANARLEHLATDGIPYLATFGSGPHMLMTTMSVVQSGAPWRLVPVIQAAMGKFSAKLDTRTHLPKGSIPAHHSGRVDIGSSLLDIGRGDPASSAASSVRQAGQWGEMERDLGRIFAEMFMHFLAIGAFAVSYGQYVVSKRPKVTYQFEFEAKKRARAAMNDEQEVYGGEGFHFSLFGCFRDLDYMAYSCLCPHIRAADTLAAAGILSFEAGLMLYMVIFLCQHFGPAFHLISSLFIALPLASNRRKLRQMYGGQTMNGFRDYAVHACCWTCAVSKKPSMLMI